MKFAQRSSRGSDAMGRRTKTRPRCAVCGLHLELCVCEFLPRVANRTRVLIVQNNHERGKPTNTARLVAAVLENCTMTHYAVRSEDFDPSPLHGIAPASLLFPNDTATTLDADHDIATLVILDGTWAQCSRMSRRIPELRPLPTVTLPAGASTRWAGVRTTDDAARLSTYEAVTRALAILEGPQVAESMLPFFERVAAGMLFMKGKLRSPRVPEAWHEPTTK